MVNKDGLRIKTLEIVGDKLFFDGEELTYVSKFSLDFNKKRRGESFEEVIYPFFEAKGLLLDKKGKPVVRYGELIDYNIAERVIFIGGSSHE